LLIVNSNELDQKDQRKRKRKRKKRRSLAAIGFFTTPPPLKQATKIIVAIFCNKAIEEGDNSLVLLPSSLQQNHRRR